MVESAVEIVNGQAVVEGGIGIMLADETVEQVVAVDHGLAVDVGGQCQVFILLQVLYALALNDALLKLLIVVASEMDEQQRVFTLCAVVCAVAHHEATVALEQLPFKEVPGCHVHAQFVEHVEVIVAQEAGHPVHPLLVGEVAGAAVGEGVVSQSSPPPAEHPRCEFRAAHGTETEVEDAVDVHGPLRMLTLIINMQAGHLWCQCYVVLLELEENTVYGREYKDVRVKVNSSLVTQFEYVLETGRLDGRTEFCQVVLEGHVRPLRSCVISHVPGLQHAVGQVCRFGIELVSHENIEVHIGVVLSER